MPDFRIHDLRRTIATHLRLSGVDRATIGQLLGYADLKMTRRYAPITGDVVRRAIDRLLTETDSPPIRLRP